MHLTGTHILLGISGGIAAFKTPELVRGLRKAGADVQVVLTAGAQRFVTPTTLQAVSGRAVRDDLWDTAAEAAMGHIELARWADVVLIAPATAQCLATLARGAAPDLLSTLYLATSAPVVVAPAMNQAMWRHPATQRNVEQLALDGVRLVGPASGEQACGDEGAGRMVEPQELIEVVDAVVDEGRTDTDRTVVRLEDGTSEGAAPDLRGRKILVTAGPTREALDPVRYLTNRSSGRQGYAIAALAAACGAQVTLVSGPVQLACPPGVQCLDVQSATEMHDTVMAQAPAQDAVIGVAAVADYRPRARADQKIKKTDRSDGSDERGLTLELVENPDIIAAVAALPAGPLTVGFAAETHDTLAHARAKRLRKGLDLIVVNDVSRSDIGFGTDHNAATIISSDGEQALPRQPKEAIALAVLQALAVRLSAAPAAAG